MVNSYRLKCQLIFLTRVKIHFVLSKSKPSALLVATGAVTWQFQVMYISFLYHVIAVWWYYPSMFWLHSMSIDIQDKIRMTSSNGNIFRVTGHLCGEFDVFVDLRLNKRLSKQSWGWWFETLSRPLWRHCNVSTAQCQPYVWYDMNVVINYIKWLRIKKYYSYRWRVINLSKSLNQRFVNHGVHQMEACVTDVGTSIWKMISMACDLSLCTDMSDIVQYLFLDTMSLTHRRIIWFLRYPAACCASLSAIIWKCAIGPPSF